MYPYYSAGAMGNEQRPDMGASYQAGAECSPARLSFLNDYVETLWSRAQDLHSPTCFPGHITAVDGFFVTIVPDDRATAPPWERTDIQLCYNVDNNWTIAYRRGRRSAMRHDDRRWVREIDTYTLAHGTRVMRIVQKGYVDSEDGEDTFLSLESYDLGSLISEDVDMLIATLQFIEKGESRRSRFRVFMARVVDILLRRPADKSGAVDS